MNDFYSGSRTRRRRPRSPAGGGTNRSSAPPSTTKRKGASPSTGKQRIWTILSALITFGLWYLTPVSQLLVNVLLEFVPVESDLELGREAYFRDAHLSKDTYHDPKWTRHLQRIGRHLVESSTSLFPKTKDYDWDFAVVKDDRQVNALCLPGGIVRVTSGLLKTLDLTDGEIAALLGHEMGHVLNRHGQSRLLERKVLQTVMEAMVYKDDDPHQESFGEAIGELLIHSADWLGQQSFSRANEYEADETSWKLLLSPHNSYHPKALQSLLTKLWQATGEKGGGTSWDSTHPGTLDRIKALDDKWKELPDSERQAIDRKYAVF